MQCIQLFLAMVSMTDDQFQALLNRMGPAVPMRPPTGMNRGYEKTMNPRYMKLHDFDGNASSWGDWAFGFRRAVRSTSVEAYHIMDDVEKVPTELDEKDPGGHRPAVDVDVDKLSAELHDILCQCVSGEAMAIVRSVDDFQGFKAWQKLHRKYNPRTMARAIRMMGEVANPQHVKDVKDVEMALNRWEGKVKTLHKEFGEEVGETMRIAIMTSMLPTVIQDYIYTNITEKTAFADILEKVRSWVSNRVAMTGGPTPMDIGEVEDWGEAEHDDGDVMAVGAWTKCHRCEGWGHMQRECPTQSKGKGKGKDSSMQDGKGGQKGYYGGYSKGGQKGGKGDSKGGKGPKGGGKGYQGTCWRCGQLGHKSPECTAPQVNNVQYVHEEMQEAEIGGIWMIGHVEAERWETVNHKNAKLHGCRNPPGFNIEVHNPFRMLEPDDDEEIEGVDANIFIGHVGDGGRKLSRASGMRFNVAKVKRPLASAAKVVQAGNRIQMGPRPEDNYIQNLETGEKIAIRVERGTYVFDVEYKDGSEGTITLDSGAGVNVWPEELLPNIPMMAKDPGLRMTAANGTQIENLGTKVVEFRGVEPGFIGQA